MINERIALLLLNGEAGRLANDNSHYTREFYHCMEGFAKASVATCQSGNLKKFESHLNIAKKLYAEGNETVKNGIVNVFLYKALDMLDQIPAARKAAEKCLPAELLEEMSRQHYCSGM
jgi:hypothetical protein